MKKTVLTLLTLGALLIGNRGYAISCQAACDVNLRKEPRDDARIVYIAKEGETLEIVEREGEWLCVHIGGGEIAYVRNALVMTEEDYTAKENRRRKRSVGRDCDRFGGKQRRAGTRSTSRRRASLHFGKRGGSRRRCSFPDRFLWGQRCRLQRARQSCRV